MTRKPARKQAQKEKTVSTEREETPRERLRKKVEKAMGGPLEKVADSDTDPFVSYSSLKGAGFRSSSVDVEFLIPQDIDEATFEARVAETLADITRAREKMRSDQLEIDRLKAETRAMIARLLAA